MGEQSRRMDIVAVEILAEREGFEPSIEVLAPITV